MQQVKFFTIRKELPGSLADLLTPVAIYLKIRDRFPQALLLESSDYHGNKNSMSYICFDELASFVVDDFKLNYQLPGVEEVAKEIEDNGEVAEYFNDFLAAFDYEKNEDSEDVTGLFGYSTYDSVQYFEDIRFKSKPNSESQIPDLRYGFFRYVIAFNHFHNQLYLIENVLLDDKSRSQDVVDLLLNRNTGNYKFYPSEEEFSTTSELEYRKMVYKGKQHCYKGDVFQMVMSRRFSQAFRGDEFNVYRALRRINPSPYLFYFDYGDYRIFGSSPEAQLIINEQEAIINPIAGTFRRTGDDEKDRELATELMNDPKENAEHVMLVDLARNDLSRNSEEVEVSNYREIQYYSHVLHMVSEVTGKLPEKYNVVKVYGDCFPAGTLSGAPKYKAMTLIDEYEPHRRGYYGGAIGFMGFNGSLNHAIMIRSFLSKNNQLFYQAGAGIVADSKEENELQEVNNKLGALKKAIMEAKFFNYETE
ncbi:anthranilate synthase component I family protein [Prolixibacteraceae bacterium JC049]|nr:anthranilate synthase component I family protein [Prolixibacteraceae bacterium JC049]